jgi:hypothetical protein
LALEDRLILRILATGRVLVENGCVGMAAILVVGGALGNEGDFGIVRAAI